MVIIRMMLIFFTLSLPVSTVALADYSEKSLVDEAKAKFVRHLSIDWDDYQVCEAYSKNDDKVAFLKRSLGLKDISEIKNLYWKEVFARKEGELNRLHLGIIALGYLNDKVAKKTYAFVKQKASDYFDNTLILTKYKILIRNNIVVFLYSETFIDEKIEVFFEQIDKNLGTGD